MIIQLCSSDHQFWLTLTHVASHMYMQALLQVQLMATELQGTSIAYLLIQ